MDIKSKVSFMNLLFIFSSLLIVICTFTACNNYNLEKIKLMQKEELQQYLDSKQQSNYTVENWNMICEIIKNGQDNVNLSKNISEIKYSVCDAKMSVEAISPKESHPIKNGAFA